MDSAVVPWPWPSKAKISNPGAVEVITTVEVITVQRRTESASRGNFVTMMRSLQERHNVTPGMSGFKFPFKCPEKYNRQLELNLKPLLKQCSWDKYYKDKDQLQLPRPHIAICIFRPISRFSRQFHGFSLAGQLFNYPLSVKFKHFFLFPWNLKNLFLFPWNLGKFSFFPDEAVDSRWAWDWGGDRLMDSLRLRLGWIRQKWPALSDSDGFSSETKSDWPGDSRAPWWWICDRQAQVRFGQIVKTCC